MLLLHCAGAVAQDSDPVQPAFPQDRNPVPLPAFPQDRNPVPLPVSPTLRLWAARYSELISREQDRMILFAFRANHALDHPGGCGNLVRLAWEPKGLSPMTENDAPFLPPPTAEHRQIAVQQFERANQVV